MDGYTCTVTIFRREGCYLYHYCVHDGLEPRYSYEGWGDADGAMRAAFERMLDLLEVFEWEKGVINQKESKG
jgi:hypothetical protein